MKKFSAYLAITGLMLVSGTAFASQDGTTTAAFLRIGQGARAEGMGGAFTAIADDAYATYWNPAGLAQITRQELAINHVQFIENINSQYLSYVVPLNKVGGSLGFSGTYANFGTIDRRDATGAVDGGDNKVNAYEGAMSWGQAFGENFALGGSLKAFSQNLAGEKASGVAADIGLLYYIVDDRLALGVTGSNLGPKIKVGTVEEDLPLTFRGGLAFHAIPKQLTFAVDLEKEKSTDAILHGGVEYTYQGRFIIRGGYQDTKDAGGGLSAGAGFVWRPKSQASPTDVFGDKQVKSSDFEIRLDYGFVDYGDFDATHRLGFHLAF